MIIKQIKSNGGRSKAERVTRLTNYISGRNTENRTGGEVNKVDYYGGRGFICDSFLARQAEMIALANDAPRSTNPVTHWVLSWKTGEIPKPDQMEQAVDILLNELELKTHQAIYASHKDSDNYHLHIAVNRVHPLTEKVIKSGGGFDIELAHKAIAKIENLQGWMSEERRRYRVVDGEVTRVKYATANIKYHQEIEIHQGTKSAERIAIETGAVLMRQSKTWNELHEKLSANGMYLEKHGTSGAYLYVGDIKLKASSAGRDCSYPQLVKRLGNFEEAAKSLRVEKIQPELLDNLSHDRQSYFEAKINYKNLVATSVVPLKTRHGEETEKLISSQKVEREKIFSRSWVGKGDLLIAFRKVIAEDHKEQRSQLKLRQVTEMSQVKSKFSPFPEFEEWTGNLAAKALESHQRTLQGLPNSLFDELVVELEKLRSLQVTTIIESESLLKTETVSPDVENLNYALMVAGFCHKILNELESDDFVSKDYRIRLEDNRLIITRSGNSQEIVLQVTSQEVEINNLTKSDIDSFARVSEQIDLEREKLIRMTESHRVM